MRVAADQHGVRSPGVRLTIPELSFVVLIGASGCGESRFARRRFKPTEVLSSDTYRGLVSDDENDQSATEDAFDALYYVARKRLVARRLNPVHYDLTTSERLLKIPDDDMRVITADGSVTGTRTEVQNAPGGTVTDTWNWDLKLELPPPAGP